MLDGHFQKRCLNLTSQPLLHRIILPGEKLLPSLSYFPAFIYFLFFLICEDRQEIAGGKAPPQLERKAQSPLSRESSTAPLRAKKDVGKSRVNWMRRKRQEKTEIKINLLGQTKLSGMKQMLSISL